MGFIPDPPSTGGGRFVPAAGQEKPVSTAPARQIPSYDPMGNFTGYYEDTTPVSSMPYAEQMANLKDVAVSGGKSALASIPGIFGDVQNLAGWAQGAVGLPSTGVLQLPTTENIRDFAFGEPETAAEKIGAFIGPFLSPNLGPKVVGKGLRALGESALIGRPSAEAAKVAQAAEDAGYTVSARQVRQNAPKSEALSPAEQIKINRKVTAQTGEEADSVSREFLEGRAKDFDKKYRKIYSGIFDIDKDMADLLEEIAKQEARIYPAGSPEVMGVARNLVNKYKAAEIKAAEIEAFNAMRQQIINAKKGAGNFVEKTFAPGERIEAAPLTQALLNEMNASNYKNVRPITSPDAPLWGADVKKALDELSEKLGMRVNPGIYVGSGGDAYGWASPTGHIFINEALISNPQDALATALHEFGHQAEFQLFEYATPETKKAIRDAWAAAKKADMGKNVEQLRPVTSDKYTPKHQQMIPSTAKDVRYYHGFNEWFAEQTSRWLTTTQKPVTAIEKFFKSVSDAWKAIYARVVGHTPLTSEVKEFLEANWEGKLINESVVNKIYQDPGAIPIETTAPGTTAAAPRTPVIAKIEGEDLRRLRSEMAYQAANHTDGNIRFQARQIVDEIDAAIERTNPHIAAVLKKTNQQYRAYMTLKDMVESNAGNINKAGHVSPEALANTMKAEPALNRHPLAPQARYGSALGMRSITQGSQGETDVLRSVLDRGERLARFLTSPLSTPLGRGARTIQRRMRPDIGPPQNTLPAAVAGVGGRLVPQREDD